MGRMWGSAGGRRLLVNDRAINRPSQPWLASHHRSIHRSHTRAGPLCGPIRSIHSHNARLAAMHDAAIPSSFFSRCSFVRGGRYHAYTEPPLGVLEWGGFGARKGRIELDRSNRSKSSYFCRDSALSPYISQDWFGGRADVRNSGRSYKLCAERRAKA